MGVFVELIAAVAAPEKPIVLAVLKIPLMVAVPEVLKPIAVVPASMVDPATIVKLFKALRATPRLLVLNKEPEFTSPTEIFPVTLVAEPRVAPPGSVLFIFKFP